MPQVAIINSVPGFLLFASGALDFLVIKVFQLVQYIGAAGHSLAVEALPKISALLPKPRTFRLRYPVRASTVG